MLAEDKHREKIHKQINYRTEQTFVVNLILLIGYCFDFAAIKKCTKLCDKRLFVRGIIKWQFQGDFNEY